MKKVFVLLLCGFCFLSILNAQWSYNLSDSRKSVSKNVSLERIINSESKYYNVKLMKKINSLIWVYLKNWDKAFKNWNYSLAIKNYELAIRNLKGIRWVEYFIKRIEQRIEEIRRLNLNPENGKIRPLLNNKSSNSKLLKKYF